MKGEATITVTYGDFSDSVVVNVISIQDLYQLIFTKLEDVTQNLSEVSSSLIDSWHFAIWDSGDYSYTKVVFNLYLETGSRITSRNQIVNAYNTAYGTTNDKSIVGLMLQDDFSLTVIIVKKAYKTLGAFSSAQTKFNEVKNISNLWILLYQATLKFKIITSKLKLYMTHLIILLEVFQHFQQIFTHWNPKYKK